MSPQERQKALNDISPEELEKIKGHQASTQGANTVDNEWLLLTEFAMTFGWQAYIDATQDKIPMTEMLTLVEASRKIKAMQFYQNAQAVLIGTGSANAKKPAQTFKSLTKDIIKKTKVQD